MRGATRIAAALAACGITAAAAIAQIERSTDPLLQEIVALERSALDKWIHMDPQGYLDAFAPDVTYFDPDRDKRVDGLPAMEAILAPRKGMKSPVRDPRYEMIDPRIQRHGDVVILTFNLASYGRLREEPERLLARWNSTQVYRRADGAWKIIHSHWSYTKPELKQPRSTI